ncbi:alpha/beta hydrolase family protein [Simkania sp.]|uniref:alpha/beta hydrolase family protein n=1 Tax=Simkania sp. TaxID=34094 RepID=UPI003B517497
MKRVLLKTFLFVFCLTSFAFANEEKCATPSHIGQKTVCTYANGRPILIDVWFSTKKGNPEASESCWQLPLIAHDAPIPNHPLPLILISHGYGGARNEQVWLAEQLALAGYIVASLDHYGNTWKDPTPKGMIEMWHRPQDVSATIDYLTTTSPFVDAIDPSDIGFVGFSIGGMTGLWLAGAEVKSTEALHHFAGEASQNMIESIDFQEGMKSFRDPRISHFVLLAPRASEFTPESLHKIESPILVIYGTEDAVLPPHEHALTIPSTQTLPLERAGHFVFLNSVSEQGKQALSPALCEGNEERPLFHKQVSQEIIRFFKVN